MMRSPLCGKSGECRGRAGGRVPPAALPDRARPSRTARMRASKVIAGGEKRGHVRAGLQAASWYRPPKAFEKHARRAFMGHSGHPSSVSLPTMALGPVTTPCPRRESIDTPGQYDARITNDGLHACFDYNDRYQNRLPGRLALWLVPSAWQIRGEELYHAKGMANGLLSLKC